MCKRATFLPRQEPWLWLSGIALKDANMLDNLLFCRSVHFRFNTVLICFLPFFFVCGTAIVCVIAACNALFKFPLAPSALIFLNTARILLWLFAATVTGTGKDLRLFFDWLPK